MNFPAGDRPVTRGDWLNLLLLMLVPVYNLVLLVTLAGSRTAPRTLVNFAKAYLWLMGAAAGLSLISGIATGLAGAF